MKLYNWHGRGYTWKSKHRTTSITLAHLRTSFLYGSTAITTHRTTASACPFYKINRVWSCMWQKVHAATGIKRGWERCCLWEARRAGTKWKVPESQRECQIKNRWLESCSATDVQYTPRYCWLSLCYAVSAKLFIAWQSKLRERKYLIKENIQKEVFKRKHSKRNRLKMK